MPKLKGRLDITMQNPLWYNQLLIPWLNTLACRDLCLCSKILINLIYLLKLLFPKLIKNKWLFSPTSMGKDIVLGLSKFSISIRDEYLGITWQMMSWIYCHTVTQDSYNSFYKTGLGHLCYRLYQRSIYTHILKDLFYRSIHTKYTWL